jgi:hypothetical protein
MLGIEYTYNFLVHNDSLLVAYFVNKVSLTLTFTSLT